ncbi:hypothetical protein BH20ACT4_BH20ACT4_07090 [soil metagenome]
MDNDGVTDAGAVDTNGDGLADQNILDTDGDGVADTWAIDSNQDSIADEVAIDQNRDGVADVWAVDPNQDAVMDTMHVDANLDGLPDATPVYDSSVSSPLYPSSAVIGGTDAGTGTGPYFPEVMVGPGVVGPATNPQPGTAMDILEQARNTTDPVLQGQLLDLSQMVADSNDDMIDTILSDVVVDVDLD